MIGSWLRRRFGRKVIKLSLDGGFTCPNRDGSKGWGGCLFCSESGSGDMASALRSSEEREKTQPEADAGASISCALQNQIRLLSDKWPQAGYLAYFQSHTNTYAPVSELREKFESALSQPDVLGLAIATRSACISEEALALLQELNERTFLWVELGLQTIHDETAEAMNLCHTLRDYDDAVRRLSSRGIRIVTHLILGLPGESKEMMMDSIRYVCRPLTSDMRSPQGCPAACANPSGERGSRVSGTGSEGATASGHIFGLKLHMLNVVRGSGMETGYPDYVPFNSIDEYTDLVIECLELIPPDITLHRISGDAPRSTLIAPFWSYQKRTILNEIHRKLRERNTWQGRLRQG